MANKENKKRLNNRKYNMEISECRLCHNNDLVEILDLGNHVLSGRFPEKIRQTLLVNLWC